MLYDQPDCPGSTDPRSEGTHCEGTRQHPQVTPQPPAPAMRVDDARASESRNLVQPDFPRCTCRLGTDDGCEVLFINDACPIHGKGINLPPYPPGVARREAARLREAHAALTDIDLRVRNALAAVRAGVAGRESDCYLVLCDIEGISDCGLGKRGHTSAKGAKNGR